MPTNTHLPFKKVSNSTARSIQASDFPFFPTVFLAGAPRCGTTSISKLLAAHPEICFSRPKELNYFGSASADIVANIERDYLDRYFGHFDPDQHRVLAEGSVSYVYDPVALEQITTIQPDARFVIAIRNPVDMLRSYHFRLLYLLEEDQVDFETAWSLQEARARGERIPKRCTEPRRLGYRAVASLGTQLERLIKLAGPDRYHIVVADDMIEEPVETCRRLLRFCGVNDDLAQLAETSEIDRDRPFPHRYKSRTYRWRWLQQLLYKPPAVIFRSVARAEVDRGVRPMRIKRLHKKLAKFNKVNRAPSPFSPELTDRLMHEFDGEIRTLEDILGRDLSTWRHRPATAAIKS